MKIKNNELITAIEKQIEKMDIKFLSIVETPEPTIRYEQSPGLEVTPTASYKIPVIELYLEDKHLKFVPLSTIDVQIVSNFHMMAPRIMKFRKHKIHTIHTERIHSARLTKHNEQDELTLMIKP